MTSLGPFFLSLDINIPGLNIPVTVSVQGTAVGAVFHVAPESLDWSRQLVLVPVKKELVLTNEVIIPAAFTCTLHPVVSGFICEVCLGLFARYVWVYLRGMSGFICEVCLVDVINGDFTTT